MSKAFTKDDGGDETPLIPPRAALPDGVPNLVTPRGLSLLHAEQTELEGERSRLLGDAADDAEARHRLAVLHGRLAELTARIAAAQVVDASQPAANDVVRFGATVTVRVSSDDGDEERRFKIVGVDEADPNRGLIAFVAPIARTVLGGREGDVAVLQAGGGEQDLEILAIEYE